MGCRYVCLEKRSGVNECKVLWCQVDIFGR